MSVVKIGRLCSMLLLLVISSSTWGLVQAPGRVVGLSQGVDMDRLIARTVYSRSESSPFCREASVWRV